MKFGQSGSLFRKPSTPMKARWKLYHARCYPRRPRSGEHMGFILDKLEKVPDLIRCTLALTH
jgi:hypothetical protein